MSEQAAKLKEDISELLGHPIAAEARLTLDELAELKTLSESAQLPEPLCEISMSGTTSADPRLRNKEYRRFLLDRLGFTQLSQRYPRFGCMKFDFILDLDWTLVHTILVRSENPFMTSDEYCGELLKKYKKHECIPIKYGDKLMLIAVRPHVREFLKSLYPVANLYIYSTGHEEYVNLVLNKCGIRKYFTRIFAVGGLSHVSPSSEKSLTRMRRELQIDLDLSRTFILDDQIDVWSQECQAHIIPSMRFVPLVEDDWEFKYHSPSSQKRHGYVYSKALPWYNDPTDPFMVKELHQFEAIWRVLKQIHKQNFVENNKNSLVEQYHRQRNKLAGQQFSLRELANDEVKAQNFQSIITSLGGEVVADSGTVVIETGSAPADCISTKALIQHFFLLSSR